MSKKYMQKSILLIIFCVLLFFSLYFISSKISADLTKKDIQQEIMANQDLISQLIDSKELEREEYRNSLISVIDDENMTIKLDTTQPELIHEPEMTTFSIEGNISSPHILDNDDKAYYLNSGSEPWHLKNGETLEIEIYANEEYFNSLGSLVFGYCLNQNEEQIENFKINKYKKILFTTSTPGDYSFYLHCISSDPIIIEGVVIK